MTLPILALITALIGAFAKVAPVLVDAINKHYDRKETTDADTMRTIASHDPKRAAPLLQSFADRVLRYKARLAALGRFQRPHS